jgi:hypothetical protein
VSVLFSEGVRAWMHHRGGGGAAHVDAVGQAEHVREVGDGLTMLLLRCAGYMFGRGD